MPTKKLTGEDVDGLLGLMAVRLEQNLQDDQSGDWTEDAIELADYSRELELAGVDWRAKFDRDDVVRVARIRASI